MSNHSILSYIIILLASLSVGMIIGLIVRPRTYYHGPNANKFCKKIFYDTTCHKCIKFGITIVGQKHM